MGNDKRGMLRRGIALGTVSAMLLVLILLIVYSKLKFDIGVICPFKEVLGLDCPGCGGTRMAVSILNLNFYQALRYNPYIFLTAPILVFVYVKQAYLFIVKNELINWLDKFLVGYAAALILFGILRNIEMFSWLAPTTLN